MYPAIARGVKVVDPDYRSQAEDKALRLVPWLSKTISNQAYFFVSSNKQALPITTEFPATGVLPQKYAQINNTSLFLVTTLDKVYSESLTPSRLISRASASAKLTQEASQISAIGGGGVRPPYAGSQSQSQSQGFGRGNSFGESQNRDAALKSCFKGLEEVFTVGEGWEDVDVELGDQDILVRGMLEFIRIAHMG